MEGNFLSLRRADAEVTDLTRDEILIFLNGKKEDSYCETMRNTFSSPRLMSHIDRVTTERSHNTQKSQRTKVVLLKGRQVWQERLVSRLFCFFISLSE